MKKMMLALALVSLAVGVKAQEPDIPRSRYSVSTNSFWANWYISAGGDYSVSGIPAGTEGLNPVELLQTLVAETGDKVDVKEEVHHVMALGLARKSAIPVGQALSSEEMEDLVEKLFLCETPNYTPNGKLVLTILANEKVERMFD